MDLDYDDSGSLACGVCRDEKHFCGVSGLLTHYRLAHGQLARYICWQGGCCKFFSHLTSMIRHIKLAHKELFHPLAGPSCHVANSIENVSGAGSGEGSFSMMRRFHPLDSDDENDTVTFGIGNAEEPELTPESEQSPQEDAYKAAVRVLVNLRSTASLTGKAMERFQTGTNLMIKELLASLKRRVSSKLSEKGMSAEDVSDVLAGITIDDPFANLKSIDDQLKTFSREFGLVQPVSKLLDTRVDKRLDPETNCRVQTQVKETFQYVPMIETLSSLLKNKKMKDIIFNSQPSSDGVLRSYLDGSHYKNHPFLQKHKEVILILLFFDELEITNSLGSKTIIHKLATFFFQVLNLPPSVSSQLASIYLLALAHADDLNKEGAMKKVLTPLIHELKKLTSDEGVPINVDGEILVVRALLVGVSADTLAAHDLLGFLGVGAKYFCRKCLVSRDEVRANANATAELRSKEQHQVHLEEVARRPKFSSQCGVKRSCPLDEVPYFDCTSSSIFDAFHDFLEGIVPLTIKLTLPHFIFVKKFFSVSDLNLQIASFSYGLPDAKNRPSPNFTADMLITSQGKVKQYGSQMWCLMRSFPFLLGHWVPDDDPYMGHIFLLQDVMKIIFAFEVRVEELERLDALISMHHESFMTLFIQTQEQEAFLISEEVEVDDAEEMSGGMTGREAVEASVAGEEGTGTAGASNSQRRKKMGKVYVTNKLHFATHYKDMIQMFGPAIRIWCAKFEARLKIFRPHASICCNFRNPPMTMAKMFQLSNMDSFLNEGFDQIEFQKGTMMKLQHQTAHADLLNTLGLPRTCDVIYTNSATVHGEEYRPGLFVCIPNPSSQDPVFALIRYVLVANSQVFLIIKTWKNNGLHPKYNAHSVSQDEVAAEAVIETKSLRHYRCMAPWTVSEASEIFVSLRTILV